MRTQSMAAHLEYQAPLARLSCAQQCGHLTQKEVVQLR